MKKVRQTNIELLRMVSMFMILLLHANVFTFGWPEGDFTTKLFRLSAESFTIIAVNVFVLITGYLGTSFKLSKIANLVFQMIFTVFSITLLLLVFKLHSFSSWKDVVHGLYFWDYWFINAYIGLLIFSPLANLAIQYLSHTQMKVLLISMYILFCIIEGDFFISPFGIGVRSGYSVIWFLFIYLVGRYIAKYPPQMEFKKLIAVYLLSIMGALGLMWLCRDYGYNSPFIVIESIAFFLIFLKIKIPTCKSINYIASSSLMVFLLHCHPILVNYYKQALVYLNGEYGNGLAFIILLLVFCIIVYSVAIGYDQFRKFIWHFIEPRVRDIDGIYKKERSEN